MLRSVTGRGGDSILTDQVYPTQSNRWTFFNFFKMDTNNFCINYYNIPIKKNQSNWFSWPFSLHPSQAEYFYILSQYDERKALDVRRANPKAGSDVIMYAKWPTPTDNQLWYQDTMGIIRSKLNGFTLTVGSRWRYTIQANHILFPCLCSAPGLYTRTHISFKL